MLEQDRGRWDRLLIRRGLAALERAERLGGALGPYALQAAIAACHARAATADETDWARIVALVRRARRARAVAGRAAQSRRRGLDGVRPGGRRSRSSTRWSKAASSSPITCLRAVRGDLLAKLGRLGEARAEFERAAALTRNERERRLLTEREPKPVAPLAAPTPLP